MKILELCLSSGKGGLEIYVAWAIDWFRKNNMTCHCLVKQNGELAGLLNDMNLSFDYFSKSNHLLPVVAAYKLAKYIDQHDIDIVHINWAKDLNLVVLAKIFSHKKFRLVLTRHMKITRFKHDVYHKWLYAAVDKMIVGTKLLQSEVNKFIPIEPERVTLSYLGVKESTFAESACQDLVSTNDNPPDLKVVLFGRIEHGKGQHVLVEAIEILKKKGIQVGAWIIGHTMDRGYKEKLLVKIKQNKLEDNIHFMNFYPAPMKIMPCFDAVLLTTYEETFGLVMVEAMMTGTLAVGTNAGGVPEIIDDNETGLLFTPGDAASLANKLEWISQHPQETKAIAEKGKQKADRIFSEQSHFEKLTQEFNSLV